MLVFSDFCIALKTCSEESIKQESRFKKMIYTAITTVVQSHLFLIIQKLSRK